VTISDGAAEVAKSVTIVTATATAGQITFTAASLDALADTTAGTVTYTLSQDDTELDSYVWSQVTIDGNQATGSMLGIIPLMVGLFVLIAVFRHDRRGVRQAGQGSSRGDHVAPTTQNHFQNLIFRGDYMKKSHDHTRLKRLAAISLVLVMCLSALPMLAPSASAAGEDYTLLGSSAGVAVDIWPYASTMASRATTM